MNWLRNVLGHVPTGLLSGITVIAILWLTLAPHPTGDMELPLFPGADKVAHALMFAFLAFMVCIETMKKNGWQMLKLPLIAVIAFACSIFGIGIEITQRAMGLGREFETLDILADAAGAFGASGIWAMVQEFFAQSDN